MFPPPRSTPIDQAETRFLPALAATARTITLRPMRAFLFREPRQYGLAQFSDAHQSRVMTTLGRADAATNRRCPPCAESRPFPFMKPNDFTHSLVPSSLHHEGNRGVFETCSRFRCAP